MPISDWPEQERPREKLLSKGAASLSDAELLAIFLRTGLQGKTAIDLSRDLLTKFDSLRGMVEADSRSFCQIRGLGLAKYSQIQAAIELGKRYLQENLGKKTYSAAQTIQKTSCSPSCAPTNTRYLPAFSWITGIKSLVLTRCLKAP
jgi:DNA repair protein RadC